MTVDLDGAVRTVHTTERSALGLMSSLHVGKLVAVRNIPGRLHAGSDVVLRTRHNGILVVDGQTVGFDSASSTVDELLVSNNIQLVGDDYTEPAHDAQLVNGDTVTVFRVGGETKQATEVIPFGTEQQADPTIAIGDTSVVRAGVNGTLTTTYRERVENGVVVGTTALSKVRTLEPVAQIDGYGTKADWHWDALATCESGGKWRHDRRRPGWLRRRTRDRAQHVERVRRPRVRPERRSGDARGADHRRAADLRPCTAGTRGAARATCCTGPDCPLVRCGAGYLHRGRSLAGEQLAPLVAASFVARYARDLLGRVARDSLCLGLSKW